MEKKIKTGNREYTCLDYNEREYEIEHLCEYNNGFNRKDSFILRRMKDNKTIRVFTGCISDIVQCKVDGDNYFVVIDYANAKAGGCTELFCYRDDEDEMSKVFSQECGQCTRISNHTFSMQLEGGDFVLYNIKDLTKSLYNVYDYLFDYEKIKEVYGEDILFVEEKLRSKYLYGGVDVKDTITYGIDVDTLEIKTPIWSDLQQRYIKLLSKEEISRREEYYRKKRINPNAVYIGSTIGDKTIGLEVQLPLEEISLMMDKGPSIFENEANGKINKEFVKGFRN